MNPTRTIRLTLEYDGTGFVGWQMQRSGRSIQGELQRALEIILRESIRPVGSGRTDAATHALGQVAHFHTTSDQPTDRILRALNGVLPADIAVLHMEEATAEFHARFSALSKRYRYRIYTAKSALSRSQVWSVPYPLDQAAMASASRYLIGSHSFGAFCKQDPIPESYVCEVSHCSWEYQTRELVLEIEADRFLRHMVRIIVGTCVEIGRGKREPENVQRLLLSGERTQAGPTAPARGLCLLCVRYPDN